MLLTRKERKLIPKGWRRLRMGESLPEKYSLLCDDGRIKKSGYNQEDGIVRNDNNILVRLVKK